MFLLLRLQQPLAPLLHRLDLLAQPVVTVQLHGEPVLVLVFQFLGNLYMFRHQIDAEWFYSHRMA